MKFFFGLLIGLTIGAYGSLYAQSGGGYLNQDGTTGSFYTYPGGATDYWDTQGHRGTIYPMPGTQFGVQKPPC